MRTTPRETLSQRIAALEQQAQHAAVEIALIRVRLDAGQLKLMDADERGLVNRLRAIDAELAIARRVLAALDEAEAVIAREYVAQDEERRLASERALERAAKEAEWHAFEHKARRWGE